MPITIGNTILRNIQEQVAKNKADIAALQNVENVLNQFGVTVLGRVDAESDIPEEKPGGEDYSYGDAWLVGEETPYDMYIWTRTDDPDVGEFINIGPISMVGPEGPTGPTGPAPELNMGTVTTGEPGTNASATITGADGVYTINFTIPRGATGQTGATGAQGPQGPEGQTGATGAQGPQGDPGQSFMIIGQISNTSQLPDPSTTPRNYAYVYSDGDPTTPDRLYYIVGAVGSEQWDYSSLAAAGTTVSVGGNPVSTWSADTKVDAPSAAGTAGNVLTLGSGGTPVWAAPSGGSPTLTTVWTGKVAVSNSNADFTFNFEYGKKYRFHFQLYENQPGGAWYDIQANSEPTTNNAMFTGVIGGNSLLPFSMLNLWVRHQNDTTTRIAYSSPAFKSAAGTTFSSFLYTGTFYLIQIDEIT